MDSQKKKLTLIITGIIVGILIVIGIFFWWNQRDTPEKTVSAFVSKLNEQDYESAYGMLSKEAQSTYDQDSFITRNKNVYSGIGASDIAITFINTKEEDSVSYHQAMTLCTGSYEFDNSIKVIKEDGYYKLQWSSNVIFPELDNSDSVSVNVESAKRGTIFD